MSQKWNLFGEENNSSEKDKKAGRAFNTNTENNDTWLTPPGLIKSLGSFDLDPCTPVGRPWDTAAKHYTKIENGLVQKWEGRVWLNPPYGSELIKWLHRMSIHLNGTALIFGRTETKAFHKFIFPFAESILFIEGRIRFHTIDGKPGGDRANAPSILIGYDEYNSEMIDNSGIKGSHIYLKQKIFIAGISLDKNKTWRVIVGEALEELNREAQLPEIYEAVMRLAPNRIKKNQHYKAKVRQVLQSHFEKISTATYAI